MIRNFCSVARLVSPAVKVAAQRFANRFANRLRLRAESRAAAQKRTGPTTNPDRAAPGRGVPAVTLSLVVLALLPAGCVNISADSDPVSLFRLDPVPLGERVADTAPLRLSLEVTGNEMFDNQRLWVFTGDNKVQAFAGARWVMPLTDLVEQVTTRSLERGALATVVGRADADAHLVLSLREFQAERGERGELVRAALRAQLVIAGADPHYRHFAVDREASLASAAQLAGAFDAAYATLITEVAAWLAERIERVEPG